MLGDGDGDILQLNSGYSDYNSKEILLTYESHDIELGTRGFLKGFDNIHFFSENTQAGQLFVRNDTRDQEWNIISSIKSMFEDVRPGTIRARFFNIKFTDVSKTGQSKVLGYDIHGVKSFSSTDL